MTLAVAVDELWTSANRLRDDARALRLTAVEDRPLRLESKLVDDLAAGAETVDGWVAELTAAVSEAVSAAAQPGGRGRVADALSATAVALHRVAIQAHEDFGDSERLTDVLDLARRAPREPREWLDSVRTGADGLVPSLWALAAALHACWRELAEAAPATAPPTTHGLQRSV